MTEVWKDIQGYEGIYQISSKGDVRSLTREQKDRNGRNVTYNGKSLKAKANSKGYLRVQLKKSNKTECVFVHRLVALHFVENPYPQKLRIVNHIDSNFLNNAAENLEWTTLKGNMQHALKKGRLDRTATWLERLHKAQKKYYKPVVGYNPLTGEVLYTFRNVNEGKQYGFQASCICNCCKGLRQRHKGLAWKYADARMVSK